MSVQDFLNSFEDTCGPTEPTEEGLEPSSVHLSWSAKGVGFGSFYFFYKDGQLYCENECMGKGFIKEMLNKMVDDCLLMDEYDHEAKKWKPRREI